MKQTMQSYKQRNRTIEIRLRRIGNKASDYIASLSTERKKKEEDPTEIRRRKGEQGLN